MSNDLFEKLPDEVKEIVMSYLNLSQIAVLRFVSKSTDTYVKQFLNNIRQIILAAQHAQWHNQPIALGGINIGRQACASHNHAALLTNDGRLLMIGGNRAGQLGVSNVQFAYRLTTITLPATVRIKKVAIASGRTVLLTEDGNLLCAGNADLCFGEPTSYFKVDREMNDVQDVAIGQDFTVVVLISGHVCVSGDNYHGQIGYSRIMRECSGRLFQNLPWMVAVAVGRHHTMLLTKDGALFVAGDNEFGQLGTSDQEHRWHFTEVDGLPRIIQIKAGERYSLVQNETGQWLGAGALGLFASKKNTVELTTAFEPVEGNLVFGSDHQSL